MSEESKVLAVSKYSDKKRNFPLTTTTKKPERSCNRCGLRHAANRCPAYKQKCRTCKRIGHFAKVCRNKKTVEETEVRETSPKESLVFVAEMKHDQHNQDWYEELTFRNGCKIKFKLDSGAQCNVLSKKYARNINAKLHGSPIKKLVSFGRNTVPVLGEVEEKCKCANQEHVLKFLVVKEDLTPILGRSSCEKLNLVKRVELAEYQIPSTIFQGIGCVKGFEYDIELKEDAQLKIHPPRNIPRDASPFEVKYNIKKCQKNVNGHKKILFITPEMTPNWMASAQL
ncbi:hypothetical protein JTE90_005421 [Oedothorax gibbosus]|uniref:CCHC-type domain-containing protein n=1 Tax=Oedothorax gibbosus TaxID=931172 RepID=A0AAV6UR07_9ARAC|nr:hypothetical protein JTE90_005421 [Oedothorax gibbosus]